jgi:ribonucleoside-diphosphate reductase alpha chain
MLDELYGPHTAFGKTIHAMKYRAPGETFDDYCVRYARTTCDDEGHFRRLLRLLRGQVILPAGRQQLSVGRPYRTTAFNCFVGPMIGDDTREIFEAVRDAALTMRSGGGVGWDFSTLRPAGEPIRGLGHGAFASGPVSFMEVWNAMCQTIMSAGERRGAMMGILSVHHPDIMRFVNAKKDQTSLRNFNVSVSVTDEFMDAMQGDGLYKLKFGDAVFGTVRAVDVWSVIMENNWDYAEPGVIFIDRVNRLNPLYYCEKIAATNPCAEQPLPPDGCCLLGSINVTKLLTPQHAEDGLALAAVSGKQVVRYGIDYDLLDDAVDALVRANDNVIDRTVYPLPRHREEEVAKRRMGIGVTGVANALEVVGHPYASREYLDEQDRLLEAVLNRAYRTSVEMAKVKGAFPLFDADRYAGGEFVRRLPEDVIDGIRRYGIRNGLLTSIAPTGTISLSADNISGGIEPVFQLTGERDVLSPSGKQTFQVEDYALTFYGVRGRTANDVSAEDHVDVLCRGQRYVDSSISKTCNVSGQIGGAGPGVTFSAFKDLYVRAYEGGAKSCTTFNLNGKRMGIMRPTEEASDDVICSYDPLTGARSCEA